MKRKKPLNPGAIPAVLALSGLFLAGAASSVFGQTAGEAPIPLSPDYSQTEAQPATTAGRRNRGSSTAPTINFDNEEDPDADDEDAQEPPTEPIGLTGFRQPAAARATPTGPVSYGDEEGSQSRRANPAAGRVQSGIEAAEEDPFGPTGFRLGTFNGNASLEQAIGYSSNVSGRRNGDGGAFSQTDANLSLVSDWGRHELQYNLNGSYRLPFSSDEVDDPFLFTNAILRLDLIDGVTLTTDGYYNFSTQSFTSSSLTPGVVDTPGIHGTGVGVQLQRADRKLIYTLRGSVDRTTYEDADLGGGAIQSEQDRNNNLYQLTARVGYQASPTLTPFLEGRAGWRVHDQSIDRNGNMRDSDITELRGGLEMNFGDKLRGEISVGYVTEEFDDPTLTALEGYTLNGTLEWSPERDTLFRLTAGTALNSSISAGDSGSLIYTTRLEWERQVNDRLGLNAFIDYELEDNINQDTTTEFGVGLDYWINRHMALTADIEYETFSSNTGGQDFDELSARMGIRLQK